MQTSYLISIKLFEFIDADSKACRLSYYTHLTQNICGIIEIMVDFLCLATYHNIDSLNTNNFKEIYANIIFLALLSEISMSMYV